MSDDLLSLKLTVDKLGNVWYIVADGPPVNSGKPVISFLLDPAFKDVGRFRIVGTQRNAQLILALYVSKINNGSGCVELCGPNICRTNEERENAEFTLYAMRAVNTAGSMGGWHAMQHADYCSYALSSHIQKVEKIDDHARRLLKSHPLWPIISFVPHLDIDACSHLIATILDPRWYVCNKHPNRGSKLRAYLGLDKRTVAAEFASVIKKSTSHVKQVYRQRCKMVIHGWNGPNNLNLIEHPNYFLFRIFKDKSEKGAVERTLRTSQKFVEFIRLTWLALLAGQSKQLESLFVPEYFFKRKDEADAFRNYIRTTPTE